MTQPLIVLARLAAIAALSLLGACTTPAADAPAQHPAKAVVPGPFVGTIRLLERHTVLGINQTDYITLVLAGPLLRREVRPQGFADSTEQYGILADLRSDSVTYYVRDDDQNINCRLSTADYLAAVASNTAILPTLDHRPYSNIFAPLPAEWLHQEVKTGVTLGKLTDCRAMLFLAPDRSRCVAMYSGQVRVPASVLAYVEHNAPAALPSLALGVHYTPPPALGSDGLLDRLHHRLGQLFSSSTEFSSLDSRTPSAHDFDLPAGSRYAGSAAALDAKLAPVSSDDSHHSHHHHH